MKTVYTTLYCVDVSYILVAVELLIIPQSTEYLL